ncbi:hypothetical protein LIER_03317 [Lithospermum erythrorhizon]|uniref:AMP-activated protein kinase glycogen-binding domain-containing protein n=1 Tax=Lithospermum erythrorhizon TaxID=34254 RepID=A0AAV3NTG7_LITER
MAYFAHISTFHSISSYKFQLFPPSFMPHKLRPSTIYACAIKKSHREFLSNVGLPEDHLPSLKELSQHGRQDLANVVRRRGYKVMKELLAASTRTSLSTSDLEKSFSEIEEGFHDNDEDKSTGQNEKIPAPADDVSLSRSFMMMENHKSIQMDINLDSNHETYKAPEVSDVESLQQKMATFMPNGSQTPILEEEMVSLSNDIYSSSSSATWTESSDDQSYIKPETSSYSALKEKAANFIYNGQLDIIEDSGFGILSGTISEGDAVTESQNALRSGYDFTSRDPKDFASSPDGSESSIGNYKLPLQQFEGSTVDSALSSSRISWSVTAEMEREKKYNTRAAVIYFFSILNDSPSAESNSISDDCEDLDVEAEIARLKFILHQKEMELTHLKQEIEKEKHALSNLQTKAEMEISKAQQLISEKDAELQAAEESLSGLKETEIQYLGDGEVVEVCGSFNGWHDKIKMDPEESSNVLDSAGTRKSQVWTAVLWLYPGVYEIKFVVDGHWKLDPQRESVVKGSIQNNILRVDP